MRSHRKGWIETMSVFSKSYSLAIITALALTGCAEKEQPAMSRIEGLPVASETAAPTPITPNTEHQARPLSEISGTSAAPSHAADMATTDTGDALIQAGETKVMAGGNILQAAGLAFTVADDWKNVKPSSAMRVAQYELAGSGGPAEMAVFYFGRGQGGGIEDNIKRWAGQFTSDPSTTNTGAGHQVARLEKDNLRLALVKTEGTYNPGSMGPMGPADTGPKENYALFGLVVEGGPEGSLFVKVTGPKATLAEQDKALEAFAQSVRVSSFK